ncbi:MAG: hypothetical protein LAT55_12500 [Opitutales bacterium]|nr:hypothetical protein [Opitutales bacterium]
MKINKDFEEFFELLNKNKVDYLIVGGYAYAIHAEPRFTKDIDILLRVSDTNASAMITTLEDFGFGELGLTKQDFLEKEQIIQLGYPPNRIDLLTSVSGITFEQAWENKVSAKFGEIPVYFIGKEELKKNKQATGRKKDLNDLENLL